MPDASLILSGAPAQIAVNDSTNGTLYLGYINAKNFKLTAKPLFHNIISGMRYQYGTRTILKVEMLETDPAKLANLLARRDDLQDIFITASEYAVKIHDCYIQYAQKRVFGPGSNSVVELTAYTDIDTNVELIKNLLSSVKDSVDYGNFNVDGGGGIIGEGWTDADYNATSRTDPSFKNGASDYHQNLAATAADQYIYCRVTWRYDQPVKVTFSVYAQSLTNIEDMYLKIRLLNSADGELVAETGSSNAVPITGSNRYSLSKEFGLYDVDKIEVRICSDSVGTIKYDDAQLELGALTAYTEND